MGMHQQSKHSQSNGVGDALLALAAGGSVNLFTPRDPLVIGADSSGRFKAPENTFPLLRGLSLIEMDSVGPMGPKWVIAHNLSKVDFDQVYGAGFIQDLFNPTQPRTFKGTKNTAEARTKMASDALLVYASLGDTAGIKRSLEMGANPNAKTGPHLKFEEAFANCSALMHLGWKAPDNIEAVNLLLKAGAKVSYKANGTDVISWVTSGAKNYGNHEKDVEPVIDLLLAAALKEKSSYKLPNVVLFHTVNEYDGLISDSAVRALLKHGANPNAFLRGDEDILSKMAWIAGNTDGDAQVSAMMQLVEAGANVNPYKNPVKYLTATPLGAASRGSMRLFEFLLSNNASKDIIDEKGVTLLDLLKKELKETNYAQSKGRLHRMIELLEN